MKKMFAVCLTSLLLLAGCNKQIIDTTYKFDRAIIRLADDTVISGAVQAWKDYEDGEQIQIKIDGVTYLVHASNITMIAEG